MKEKFTIIPSKCCFSILHRAKKYIVSQQEIEWYGVEDFESSNPDLTRIGNLSNHKNLPVHSLIKACILNDNGTVNYYLDPTDWTKKVNGSPSNLDGSDGQVMIEIPEHYFLDWDEGGVQKVAVSLVNQIGFNHVPKFYISAYEASLNRITEKLSSIVNLTTDYRGGDNTSAWDAQPNTLLGKPVTNYPVESLAGHGDITKGFRIFARKRGSYWNAYTWKARTIINRLFMIEYATRDCQKTVDITLTAEGYKKGGLGFGATGVNDAALIAFNNLNPFVNCGVSNSIASGTGEVEYIIPFPIPQTIKVCRYRGIENIFGHLLELIDGINVWIDTPNSRIEAWLFDNPSNFNSYTKSNARFAGYLPYNTDGVVKKLSNNDMIPYEIGTSEVVDYLTYFCDRLYASNESFYTLFNAIRGSGYSFYWWYHAGIFCFKFDDWAGQSIKWVGTRLTCYPNGY